MECLSLPPHELGQCVLRQRGIVRYQTVGNSLHRLHSTLRAADQTIAIRNFNIQILSRWRTVSTDDRTFHAQQLTKFAQPSRDMSDANRAVMCRTLGIPRIHEISRTH